MVEFLGKTRELHLLSWGPKRGPNRGPAWGPRVEESGPGERASAPSTERTRRPNHSQAICTHDLFVIP